MDKQTLICLSLWRKAGRTQEDIEIPCKNLADARRLRFALYNAVRPYKPDEKAGKPARETADAELQAGIDGFSVSFKDGMPTTLLLRNKGANGAMQAALAALDGEVLADPQQLAVEASIAAVQKRLGEAQSEAADTGLAASGVRVTPYYQR